MLCTSICVKLIVYDYVCLLYLGYKKNWLFYNKRISLFILADPNIGNTLGHLRYTYLHCWILLLNKRTCCLRRIRSRVTTTSFPHPLPFSTFLRHGFFKQMQDFPCASLSISPQTKIIGMSSAAFRVTW